MKLENQKKWAQDLLTPAGVKIDPSTSSGQAVNPWDVKVINPKVYDRVLAQGSLGFGESYMQGWWTCQALDEFFTRVFDAKLQDNFRSSWTLMFDLLKAKLFNLQAKNRAFQVGQQHYDLGNDFFAGMLGQSMVYSCGYFAKAQNLDDAQFAKLDLICKKLNLQKGPFDPHSTSSGQAAQGRQQIRILDIGCGWGAFAKYAAENYGVSVVGLTVSKEQAEFAANLCKGLPVEFRLQDYRTLNEKFDHIVSVGMFEHVGVKNYRTYMEVARRCLKDDGLFLLHTIGNPKSKDTFDPWLNKYIFPNGSLPSIKQIAKSVEGLFIIEDLHNFGSDYDKTLMAWYKNFKSHWPKFAPKYGEQFYRMWEYYLLSCAAFFRVRQNQLWQIVLSPNGVKGGYKSVR